MEGGGGEQSYAANSAVQRHYFDVFAKPLLSEAVTYALRNYLQQQEQQQQQPLPLPFSVADLGCSYGPNTLLCCSSIASHILSLLPPHYSPPLELFYFFSDLPSNDFNSLFASLSDDFLPRNPNLHLFTAAVPGSFYTRLFPGRSLRLAVSSLSLHWLSQVPDEVLDPGSAAWNGGGVWIDPARPAAWAAFARQSQQDLSVFLQRRAEEMASGGVLFLLVPTRRNETPAPEPILGSLSATWDKLLQEGIITTHERDTFNVPFYFLHPNEFLHVLNTFSDDFELLRMEVFHDCKYLPRDALERMFNNTQSFGKFLANSTAAVFKPMIKKHLGDSRTQVFFEELEHVCSKDSSLSTATLINMFVAIILRK